MGRASVKVQVDGLKPLLDKLAGMKRGVRNRVLRPAIRKAYRPVVQAAKALVPTDTGWLKKSLTAKVTTSRRAGVVTGIVGPRTKFVKVFTTATGRQVKRWATKYAHLVEFGTTHSRAKSFLMAGFRTAKTQVESILRREIEEGIEREARKSGGGP